MTQYSIVVEVPLPRNTIFVARPFSSDFDGIRDAILRAIPGVTSSSPSGKIIFAASGTDLNPENVSFKKDIVEKIREARVVLAVCSQESSTNKPNPNVMYELGFARSIGKLTVVLIREGEALPADLQGDQVLFYNQGREQAIVSELTKVLTVLLGVSNTTRLIDEVSYPDIWVASAHNWLTLKPNLWRDFITILKFAKSVHELFFDLYSSDIKPLFAGVEAIYTGVIAPNRLVGIKTDCTHKWTEYIKHCDKVENDLKNDLISFIAKTWEDVDNINPSDSSQNTDFLKTLLSTNVYVDKAIQELKDNTTDVSTYNLLPKIQNYLKEINEQRAIFSEAHNRVVTSFVPQRGFYSIINDKESIQNTWALLDSLSIACHGLTSKADTLIKNLIDLLLVAERSRS